MAGYTAHLYAQQACDGRRHIDIPNFRHCYSFPYTSTPCDENGVHLRISVEVTVAADRWNAFGHKFAVGFSVESIAIRCRQDEIRHSFVLLRSGIAEFGELRCCEDACDSFYRGKLLG